MIDKSLITTLLHIGFDEKEAAVYLALLELGSGTATDIAERANVKRAIVYHVVERLKKKGYAVDVKKGAVKKFAVSDPGKVFQHVRAAVDDFKFMLPLMRALQQKGLEKPRIEFFEGEEAVLSVQVQFETYPRVRYATSMKRFYEILPKGVEAWMNRHVAGKITSHTDHLVTDTPVDRKWAKQMKRFPKQQIRFLEPGEMMEMDFAIVADQLVITSFDPLYCVVIHSEKIAQSAALLFDMAFKQGKKNTKAIEDLKKHGKAVAL